MVTELRRMTGAIVLIGILSSLVTSRSFATASFAAGDAEPRGREPPKSSAIGRGQWAKPDNRVDEAFVRSLNVQPGRTLVDRALTDKVVQPPLPWE